MKKLLLILILFCSFQGFGQSTNGAKGYWRLNGNSTDASGNNNNGNDTNITYSQANGKLNQGAGFNGSTSIIKIANNLGIFGGNITISVWFKIASQPSIGAYQTIVRQAENTNHTANYIQYQNNAGIYTLCFCRDKNAVADVKLPISGQLSLNTWYYAVYTYDGVSINAYVNSVLSGSLATSGYGTGATPNYITIGAWLNASLQYYYPINGSIDEAIISNAVWTPAQVKNEYLRVKGFLAKRDKCRILPNIQYFIQTDIFTQKTYGA